MSIDFPFASVGTSPAISAAQEQGFSKVATCLPHLVPKERNSIRENTTSIDVSQVAQSNPLLSQIHSLYFIPQEQKGEHVTFLR